jgi:multidrug efflux pump subunit AcrB
MNLKVGKISTIINICAVIGFAFCMLFDFLFGAYLSSMFIAFSFIPMICALCYQSKPETKVAGYAAMIFAGVYATFILLVYFAQLTTVRLENLTEQANVILDYQAFGLFFGLNLLGYGMMALATFFIGMTITTKSKAGKALKLLLMLHGIFAVSGLIIPMLNIFATIDGANWIGTLVLIIWCAYFTPIGILTLKYLKQ